LESLNLREDTEKEGDCPNGDWGRGNSRPEARQTGGEGGGGKSERVALDAVERC